MHSCKDVVELMLQFLDGELAEPDDRDLREHLSACPPCVDFLNTYRRTPELCREALEKDMPKELADRLTAFLRTRIAKR